MIKISIRFKHLTPEEKLIFKQLFCKHHWLSKGGTEGWPKWRVDYCIKCGKTRGKDMRVRDILKLEKLKGMNRAQRGRWAKENGKRGR